MFWGQAGLNGIRSAHRLLGVLLLQSESSALVCSDQDLSYFGGKAAFAVAFHKQISDLTASEIASCLNRNLNFVSLS